MAHLVTHFRLNQGRRSTLWVQFRVLVLMYVWHILVFFKLYIFYWTRGAVLIYYGSSQKEKLECS